MLIVWIDYEQTVNNLPCGINRSSMIKYIIGDL